MSSKKEINVKIDNNGLFVYNSKKEFHREGGPAIEYSNGNKSWY